MRRRAIVLSGLAAVVREIARKPESFYLNVVNDESPVGAVRGQLEESTE